MNNPLLQTDDLPRFSAIEPEHVEPAIDTLLADNRRDIAALLEPSGPFTWADLVEPLDVMNERLQKAWSPASHLNSVMNSDALREAYNACLPKLTEYQTELGQNTRLYEAFQALRDSDEYPRLGPAQQRSIDNTLRDFRLAGVALPPAEKARYGEIAQRMAELGSTFQENLLDATGDWQRTVTDEAELAGVPEGALAVMRQAAEREGESG